MNADSYAVLFAHVARTLPDSITERIALLTALARVLPDQHAAQPTITAMVQAMTLQEELQARLPLAFTQGGAK